MCTSQNAHFRGMYCPCTKQGASSLICILFQNLVPSRCLPRSRTCYWTRWTHGFPSASWWRLGWRSTIGYWTCSLCNCWFQEWYICAGRCHWTGTDRWQLYFTVLYISFPSSIWIPAPLMLYSMLHSTVKEWVEWMMIPRWWLPSIALFLNKQVGQSDI